MLLQLHLHSQLNAWFQWTERRQLQEDTRNIYTLGFGATYTRGFTVVPDLAQGSPRTIDSVCLYWLWRKRLWPERWGIDPCTVYPKKYAHGFVVLCFVVVMQSFIMNSHEVFIHIHQGCFAGTGAIVRLPQCQWSKPDGYGKISQCITTTKQSKAKNRVHISWDILYVDILHFNAVHINQLYLELLRYEGLSTALTHCLYDCSNTT